MTKSPKGTAKHQAIADAARELFYRKGYEATSFTDIADSAGLNRGNFYYYFRTKEEILGVVLEDRANALKQMLDEIDNEAAPGRERLINYLGRFEQNSEMRSLYGCAMGSLAMELAKGDRHLVALPMQLFQITLDWLEVQFRHEPGLSEPRVHAVETLCRLQGAALLGSVMNDAALRSRQFGIVKDWIDAICRDAAPAPRATLARQKSARSRTSPGADSSSRAGRLASSSKRS